MQWESMICRAAGCVKPFVTRPHTAQYLIVACEVTLDFRTAFTGKLLLVGITYEYEYSWEYFAEKSGEVRSKSAVVKSIFWLLYFILLLCLTSNNRCAAWASALITHKHSPKERRNQGKPKQNANVCAESSSVLCLVYRISGCTISRWFVRGGGRRRATAVLWRVNIVVSCCAFTPLSYY